MSIGTRRRFRFPGPGWADRSGLGAERGAALCCTSTAGTTPPVYRRAGEVGNAVLLPYYQHVYQTCPPWAGRGPKVRPSGAKRSPRTPPTSPTPKRAHWGRSQILGATGLRGPGRS